MATHVTARDRSIEDRRRCDEAAYRRLFVATYPVFLGIALVWSVLASIGVLKSDSGSRSVFRRARATAHAVIPFAFMG